MATVRNASPAAELVGRGADAANEDGERHARQIFMQVRCVEPARRDAGRQHHAGERVAASVRLATSHETAIRALAANQHVLVEAELGDQLAANASSVAVVTSPATSGARNRVMIRVPIARRRARPGPMRRSRRHRVSRGARATERSIEHLGHINQRLEIVCASCRVPRAVAATQNGSGADSCLTPGI